MNARMTNREDLAFNVKVGLVTGALSAGVFSAVALLLEQGARGQDPDHMSLGRIVASYFAAGLLGGPVVGAMLPLRRSYVGTLALATVGSVLVFGIFGIAERGAFWHWDVSAWKKAVTLGAIFGLTIGTLDWGQRHWR